MKRIFTFEELMNENLTNSISTNLNINENKKSIFEEKDISKTIFDYNPTDFKNYLINTNNEDIDILDLSNATVLEIIDEYTNLKSKLSPSFKKNYSSLIYNINLLENIFNIKLMPIQITDIFWYNFFSFLVNKNISLSTIKTLCSQLITALQWGARHNAQISKTFDLFKIPSFNRQQISLTQDDVSRIYHFDIRTIPRNNYYKSHMVKVKDMFVLSCNLGQRFSDMVRIDKSCFNRNIFSIVQQKTGNLARVDIYKYALDVKTTYQILEKYNYEAPIKTTISTYNKYIKQLMEYVGFNDVIKREEKIAGKIKTDYLFKKDLISSHTSRRTFATINVLRGYKYSEIRRATGHKSESGFEKYICYDIDY